MKKKTDILGKELIIKFDYVIPNSKMFCHVKTIGKIMIAISVQCLDNVKWQPKKYTQEYILKSLLGVISYVEVFTKKCVGWNLHWLIF